MLTYDRRRYARTPFRIMALEHEETSGVTTVTAVRRKDLEAAELSGAATAGPWLVRIAPQQLRRNVSGLPR